MGSPAAVQQPTTPPRPITPTTILAEELGEVCRMLVESGVDRAPLARLKRARELAVGLEAYLDACTTPESAALAELARQTRETDWEGAASAGRHEREMLSGHVEGQFLKFLVHMTGAQRVLDIGMFTGYSALAMAEALPGDGVVVACELDPDVAALAQRSLDAAPAGTKITVEVGPAIDTLRRLDAAAETFDVVFVDADKDGYLAYVEFLLDSTLLAPRAVIAVDNTLMQGQPYLPGGAETANGAAIAAFNAAIAQDPRVEQVLVPLRDGVTLIRRAPDDSR